MQLNGIVEIDDDGLPLVHELTMKAEDGEGVTFLSALLSHFKQGGKITMMTEEDELLLIHESQGDDDATFEVTPVEPEEAEEDGEGEAIQGCPD